MKNKKKNKLNILFEDKNIIIINKKGGIPTMQRKSLFSSL